MRLTVLQEEKRGKTQIEGAACAVQALRDLGTSAPLEHLMSQAAAVRDSSRSVITFSPKVCCLCTCPPTLSCRQGQQRSRRASVTLHCHARSDKQGNAAALCRYSCRSRGCAAMLAATAHLHSLRAQAGGAI